MLGRGWILVASLACLHCGRSSLRVRRVAVSDAAAESAADVTAPCVFSWSAPHAVGTLDVADIDVLVPGTPTLLGFETISDVPHNAVLALDDSGDPVAGPFALNPVRTAWREAPVSIARNGNALAAITSTGACDFFPLANDGHPTSAAIEFDMGFCFELLPSTAPTWSALAGAPDPTSATLSVLDASGRVVTHTSELIGPGEARLNPSRVAVPGGGSLLATLTVSSHTDTIRHVSAAGDVVARHEYVRASGGGLGLLSAPGGAFEAWARPEGTAELSTLALQPTDGDGAPTSSSVDVAMGVDATVSPALAYDSSAVWLAYVGGTAAMPAVRVAPIGAGGTPRGDSVALAEASVRRVLIAATASGFLVVYRTNDVGSNVFAVEGRCR